MKIYKAATALVLFAAFAYAQEDDVDGDDDGEDGDEEDEEPELIDISEMWDELQEDEDFQAWYATAEASDEVLVTEWWGYVEDIVAIVDAAVDAQELYWEDLEDLEDFFEALEDEDFAALEEELNTALDAYYTFIESVGNNADLQDAIAQIMVLTLTGDGDGSVPYVAWLQGAGSEDVNAQVSAIMALVYDMNTGEVRETFDVDAIMAEVETTFALSDVQQALADTFAQVLIAWNAISGDLETMVDTIEGSVDGIVTAYDDLITDEIHETSNKLIDIVDEVITAVEESEEIQGAKDEASGYMETLNGWIAQDDWDTVYNETLAEVQGAYDVLKTDLEEGLPERAYETEDDDEVPDNAFSFAASAAALLASAAVLSF